MSRLAQLAQLLLVQELCPDLAHDGTHADIAVECSLLYVVGASAVEQRAARAFLHPRA